MHVLNEAKAKAKPILKNILFGAPIIDNAFSDIYKFLLNYIPSRSYGNLFHCNIWITIRKGIKPEVILPLVLYLNHITYKQFNEKKKNNINLDQVAIGEKQLISSIHCRNIFFSCNYYILLIKVEKSCIIFLLL